MLNLALRLLFSVFQTRQALILENATLRHQIEVLQRNSNRPRLLWRDPAFWDLIRQMSRDNPLWGAPRIHGELLKLGIDVSQATFRVLFVFLVLDNARRKIVHFNVNESPTAVWTG